MTRISTSSCYLALAFFSAFALTACSQQTAPTFAQEKKTTEVEKEVANFDVSLHSYLDRPIFDVYLNGHDIGVAAGQPHRGEANGLMTGVSIPLGPQVITWRDAGTGETTKAANHPVLSHPDPKKHYLGVHIYPGNTVEIIPESFWPEKTPRGDEINHQWELKHGK